MSIDIKSAAEAPLVDGDLVWGSDVAETGVKVMTDVVGRTATQTLTNKTLTAPVIATINNGGILTLPSSVTDTLVGKATVDTLTNKTINSATLNNAILQGSTLITSASIVTSTIQKPTFSTYGIYTLGSIAPSVTIAQGSSPMTLEVNVLTLATALYAVTLPTAEAGRRCTLINRGLTVTVYPALDDAVSPAAANAAVVIGGYRTVTYVALDDTTWVKTSDVQDKAVQSITLGAGAVSFNVASRTVLLTGDGAGNVLEQITGGVAGQELTIVFVDALIDVDNGTSTHDTSLLGAANFTTVAANTVLNLVHDGSYWHEISRSIN
jgi:hypothetical protein